MSGADRIAEKTAGKVAGIGFRAGATAASLLDALARAGAEEVRLLALPAAKAGHPAPQALLARGYRLLPVADDAMTAPTLTESAAARAAHGTGSVAEACALAAAGPGARLAGPRTVSADRMATAALALPAPRRQQKDAPA